MFERTTYDALVIGARCAGAAAAMLMARSGLRVLAIDRGEYGTDALSTHVLMRAGVLQLHRWGVLPKIVAAGTPPVRTAIFHYGNDRVEVAIGSAKGVNALYAPRRTILDRLLVDAASEAGAEIRYGHALAGLLHSPRGRVRGAAIRDRGGSLIEIQADLIVGADGIGSTVARLVGAAVHRLGRHASATTYGYWSGLQVTGYHWYYKEGLSVGVIPTNSDQHCVFVAVPSARFREGLRGAASYHCAVAEVAPDLASKMSESAVQAQLRAFAGRVGFLRQPYGPGWALVGDSGYFKDPVTAHGISDALRDAELLTRAAATGTDQAFAGYAAVRDELSLPLFEATDAIASFEWDLDTIKEHHEVLNRAMKREVELLPALRIGSDSTEGLVGSTNLHHEKEAA
jgi:2-polyprenyl-6-methoxyphenol hydroxylase-like FAD-dependent oxidoreductase